MNLALPFGEASGQTPGPFFQGKRITIVVGSAAGSGYDVYARLLGRHMGAHIEGAPSFIVQNMPGGGGLTAANHLYNVAVKDGTVLGGMQRGIIISPLVSPSGVKYDAQKIQWLGSTTSETGVVAVWHTAPHKTIQDVMASELIVGGSGPATDAETFPRIYNKTIGTKFKIVSGYETTGPILLAMERGEVQGIGNSSWSNWLTTYSHHLHDKRVNILLQAGLEKNPDLPDVPFALDLAKSAEDRQILELFLAPNTIGRPFAAPPDVPPARVTALRTAFDASMTDARLIEEVKKAKLDLSPVTGQFIQTTIDRLFKTPPELLEVAKRSIEPEKK